MKQTANPEELHFETPITDFHSHVLPRMDDGARSPEMTAEMLRKSYAQGVRYMWATPHFYPEEDNPRDFLRRRERAASELLSVWSEEDMPKIYLGAEVAYYYGISASESAADLSMGKSRYILIEMPMREWDSQITREILSIYQRQGLIPVIAHVERCLPDRNREALEQMAQDGVLFQFNAHLVSSKANRRTVGKLFSMGCMDIIGTDCHNMMFRMPNMEDGLRGMNRLFETDIIENVLENGYRITGEAVGLCD